MEEDDLPYRAEYAKTGRANCKGCKKNIEKGSLRLAVMVQSPIFDGKMTNWYHDNCFFLKQRPKCAGDIAHLDSLRWEDQESIKKKLSAVTPADILQAATKKGKKPTKKAVKSALKDFVIEYSKSSRAVCRGCEVKIVKGALRMSKKDYESDHAKYIGGQDRWYHFECFVKLRSELEFFESAENVPGFAALEAEDKKTAKKSLPKIDPPASVKSEDVADGAPSAKKVKSEPGTNGKTANGDDGVKKKQNKEMFEYRDRLKELSQKELSSLLDFNGQAEAAGVDRKLDRLSDLMTFGALKPCQACRNGQFVYRSGFGYQCTGNLNEWTKCTNVVSEPERKVFKVPDDLAEKYPFLDGYKCKIQKRVFSVDRPSTSTTDGQSSSTAKVYRYAPLKDLTFFIVGKTTKSKSDLKKEIESWGGTVASKLTKAVVAVISNKADPLTNNKIEEAQQLNIHVIPETYLEEVGKGGNAVDKITELSISSWGGDPKALVQEAQQKSEVKKSMKSRFEMKSASKVTLKVKGGSAVDPESGLEDEAHVYSSGKDVWNSVLGLTDVQKNKNKYYKLQLLVSDSGKRYWLFRSWGRIGTTIGGTKTESMGSLEEAKAAFRNFFFERTNNNWDERHNFKKFPDCMYPVDVDYGESTIALSQTSSIPSKLSKPVQDLIAMLFDVDTMKKVMLEFELDMEKMPLGKLSKSQIQKAYSVLSNLLQKTTEDIKPHAVIEATNRFYTLIPHSFGTGAPTPLNNIEIIRAKLEMLESLMEMEVAYSLLRETKGEGDDDKHPLDAHYAKLNTDIDALDRSSDEFKLIETYVKNTHGKTHVSYSLEIEDVFKVKRNGEDKRFKPFKKLHNRQLLWHGSRLTNFAGILSQGLRVAPPEAPVTGYMFGKGIYFADMVSKSANYCMTSPTNPTGLLLLCEVALGDMYERLQADYITKLPVGKHSTKGVGANFPDPSESKIIEDGLEVPLGHPKSSNSSGSLLYNEYIVYDVAQVKARYLVKTKFAYKFK